MHGRQLTSVSRQFTDGGVLARLWAGALLLALLWFTPSAGHAGLIEYAARYTLNYYYPPNPCAATSVGGYILDGSTLGGVLSLFYRDTSIGGQTIPLTSVDVDGLACGSRLDGVLNFSLDSNDLPLSLLTSFGGGILIPDPGPPDLPLFAFAEGTEDPAIPNPGPPDIELASLDADCGFLCPEPGPPELPLFAFASPGTRVGTLSIEVFRVPEPETLLLMAAGLAGMWLGRRRK
jgi:hypothetical protein